MLIWRDETVYVENWYCKIPHHWILLTGTKLRIDFLSDFLVDFYLLICFCPVFALWIGHKPKNSLLKEKMLLFLAFYWYLLVGLLFDYYTTNI